MLLISLFVVCYFYIKEVGFEVFPERCDRGAISYLEGEGVPENWGIVTE